MIISTAETGWQSHEPCCCLIVRLVVPAELVGATYFTKSISSQASNHFVHANVISYSCYLCCSEAAWSVLATLESVQLKFFTLCFEESACQFKCSFESSHANFHPWSSSLADESMDEGFHSSGSGAVHSMEALPAVFMLVR